MINLEKMREMLAEDNTALSGEDIATTAIGKAIRKKKVDIEALIYLYQLCDYDAQWFILEKTRFSFTEIIDNIELYKVIYDYGSISDIHSVCGGFFNSKEEFLAYIQDKFGIDASKEIPYEQAVTSVNTTHFEEFIRLLINSSICSLFRSGDKGLEYRKVYLECFESILYLFKSREEIRCSNALTWEEILECLDYDVPVMDFSVLKPIMDAHVADADKKAWYIIKFLNCSVAMEEHNGYPLVDFSQFVMEALPALKEYLGESFPLNPSMYVNKYGSRNAQRTFLSEMLNGFICNYEKLTEEEREYAFYNFISPMAKNFNVKKELEETYSGLNYAARCLFLYGSSKRDLDILFQEALLYLPQSAVKAAITYLSAYKTHIFPGVTENIAEYLMADCKWGDIALPIHKLYDMNYIAKVVEKMGTLKGIYTGSTGRWGSNPFFVNALEPHLLPKEFFEKYQEHIDWHWFSANRNLNTAFLKEHKEKLNFDWMLDTIGSQIDEELAAWMIKEINRECSDTTGKLRILRSIGQATPKFLAQNIDKFYSGVHNGVVVLNVEVKLKDLVESVA